MYKNNTSEVPKEPRGQVNVEADGLMGFGWTDIIHFSESVPAHNLKCKAIMVESISARLKLSVS